jgi:hypothetical protein
MAITPLGRGVLLIAAAHSASHPSLAASSTSKGEISVTQVVEMIREAPKNPAAKQVLVAYLLGVGETAGMLLNASPVTACKSTLRLDSLGVRYVLETAVPDRSRWQETAATPLIVKDLIARADCRVAD